MNKWCLEYRMQHALRQHSQNTFTEAAVMCQVFLFATQTLYDILFAGELPNSVNNS